MKRNILIALSAFFAVCGCSFLEPFPDGSYNEDNYSEYPTIIRGFIDKAYNLRPSSYYTTEFIGLDSCTDDMLYRDKAAGNRQFAIGNAQMTSNPLSGVWTRDYEAIYYVNLFLKDDIGRKTRYLVDPGSNEVLQKCLQGDAFGLRAWYGFNLLEFWGGVGTDGSLLGVYIPTEPVAAENFDNKTLVRPSYDESVKQILADCDSALKYLPPANRDQYLQGEAFHVTGAIRYRALDAVSIKALKARVLLTWASPAFNPAGDKTRWENAARAAKEVIDFKLRSEAGGLDPRGSFMWTNPNAAEIIFLGNIVQNATYETNFYPLGFGGSANIVPSQELVDAFPMANGYPITDPASGYNKSRPYEGRDPRFYASIFYDGCTVIRNQSPYTLMYTFEIADGGKDAPGGLRTSPSGYYVKKYVSLGWNPNDVSVQTAQHSIFFLRWTHMCLAFAEAANQAAGPNTPIDGLTAKEALAYIRSRKVNTGTQDENGVGADGDPYLEACAASRSAFDKLVKNEWRIETCFEGVRFKNVRRWATDVSEINVPVSGVSIEGGQYTYNEIERRSFPSLWMPIPYREMRLAPGLVQNKGWEDWK